MKYMMTHQANTGSPHAAIVIAMVLLVSSIVRAESAGAAAIQAECEKLAEKWRPRFEQEKLSLIIAPPFVVAGDGSIERLRRYCDGTILPAMRALDAMYFDTPPSEPILVLLFETEPPYRRLAREWFGDEEVSPFGYFRRDNVMLMNVGTGTGTLVHELVHALIRYDFADVPLWFNEGLGSLYEQCRFEGEAIVGLENWRLPALQRAIRQGKLRPLREMIEDRRFGRGELVGLNYAQARYLLMYLQEKGLLRPYYAAFRASAADDPSGVQTLIKLIEPATLETFESQWRQWVLALHYPSR